MLKVFSGKWFFILIFGFMIGLIIYLAVDSNPPQTQTFYDMLTDKTQYYVRELLDLNHQLYAVMFDEVKTELNGFYLAITLVGLTISILTLQIIAAITRLPIGYLTYPGKFLVIKKSNIAQQILETKTEKGETK